jgi:hypothetical protein
MSLKVDAYTEGSVVRGLVAPDVRLRETLDMILELEILAATVVALDAGTATPTGSIAIAVDDLFAIAGNDDPALPVHAAWHRIRIEAGPYEIEGELSTMPGFDPGRALTRPTGTFVLLRDVVIGLIGRADGGEARHPHALVNRYTVDAVEADIMLGFFFPGARLVGTPIAPTGGGPAAAPASDTMTTPAAAPGVPASAAPTVPRAS